MSARRMRALSWLVTATWAIALVAIVWAWGFAPGTVAGVAVVASFVDALASTAADDLERRERWERLRG